MDDTADRMSEMVLGDAGGMLLSVSSETTSLPSQQSHRLHSNISTLQTDQASDGEDFSAAIAEVPSSDDDDSEDDNSSNPIRRRPAPRPRFIRCPRQVNVTTQSSDKKPSPHSQFQFPDVPTIDPASDKRLQAFGINLLSTPGRTRVWSQISGE